MENKLGADELMAYANEVMAKTNEVAQRSIKLMTEIKNQELNDEIESLIERTTDNEDKIKIKSLLIDYNELVNDSIDTCQKLVDLNNWNITKFSEFMEIYKNM